MKRKATIGPVSVSALVISAVVHAAGLVALAWMDWASPGAPVLSGGGGGGPIEVEIEAPGPDGGAASVTAAPMPEPPPAPDGPADAEPPPEDEPVALDPTEAFAGSSPGPEPAPPTATPLPPEARSPAPPPVAATPPAPVAVAATQSDRLVAGSAPTPEPPAAGRQPPAAGQSSEGAPGSSAPVIHDAGALRPVYPRSCLRARHQGTTVVRAFLGEDGVPARTEVLKSAGCAELDRAAVEAMLHARFRPARSWGRAVASTVDQPFEFILKPR